MHHAKFPSPRSCTQNLILYIYAQIQAQAARTTAYAQVQAHAGEKYCTYLPVTDAT